MKKKETKACNISKILYLCRAKQSEGYCSLLFAYIMVIIAQSVEHWIVVPVVVGSIPTGHPKLIVSYLNSCVVLLHRSFLYVDLSYFASCVLLFLFYEINFNQRELTV